MVVVAPSVVPYRRSGSRSGRLSKPRRRISSTRADLKVGMPLQRLVEVGRIGPVVLLVVDLHGAGVDVGLQGTEDRKTRAPGAGRGRTWIGSPCCRDWAQTLSSPLANHRVPSTPQHEKVRPRLSSFPGNPEVQCVKGRPPWPWSLGETRREAGNPALAPKPDSPGGLRHVSTSGWPRLEDPHGVGPGGPPPRGRIPDGPGRPVDVGVLLPSGPLASRSGMPTAQALKLCPQARVVPVSRKACAARSRKVREALEALVPRGPGRLHQ